MFGYVDQEGHAEVRFDDVRVAASNLIAAEGDGFMIAQARLGPGRIDHCMRRAIGTAEMALAAMCRRAAERTTFGQPVATRSNVLDWIAESRVEIEMTRLLTMKAAWLMDTVGNKHARIEIAAIKVAAPAMALKVLDRAIQIHGGAGVSEDVPLAWAWAHMRTLRLADGPDEVHKLSIARQELKHIAARSRAEARPPIDRRGVRRAPAGGSDARAIGAVLEPETPAVSLDDDREIASPRPGARVRAGRVAAEERLEDAPAVRRRDARPRVGDLDLNGAVHGLGADRDAAVRGRVPDGVLDEVEQHPLQALGVGLRRRGLAHRPRADGDRAGVRGRPHRLDGLLDQQVEAHPLHGPAELAALEPGSARTGRR